MNHTIFVTVKEFLENGGVLEIGRDFYSMGRTQIIGTYDGRFEDKDWPDMIRVRTGSGTYPAYDFNTLVEIEVTPIYK